MGANRGLDVKLYAAVARLLAARGVETMFGLMGDANMQYLVEFMAAVGGEFIGAVHESGAVTMADGYGRVTGRIGVASVTHGPGLTNTITALTEATRNRSRLLLITGETASGWNLSPQVFDIPAVIAPTGAGYERVYRADTLVADMDRAFRRIATEQRPVVLNIPFDLLNSETAGIDTAAPSMAPAGLMPAADASSIDRALGLAAGAKRPLVLAGRGAVAAGAGADLARLADILGAPLATTLLAKDYFRGHPRNLGICGTVATALAGAAIAEADCILAFGASLNKHTSGATLAVKRVVHCDADPDRIGTYTRVDAAVLGDAKVVAAAMVASLSDGGFEGGGGWDPGLAERLAAHSPLDDFDDRSDGKTVDLRAAMVRLDQILPGQRSVVTDAGRFLLGPWRYLHVADPTCFVHTTNFASIGLGLGTAIGAAVGRPGQITVAVVGDGGFMMHMAEFTTAVRNRLPIVVVVLNDGAYGADYTSLQHYGLDPAYSLIDWPDFAPVAEALGARGATVRSVEDLDALADSIRDLHGPLLIDVKVDPSVYIWG
jgi:thiamine pyrophosphate-dependent acetolactate synthase large subunit-like protein